MASIEKPKYKVIGTRPVRHDGVDKVTGRAQYGADVQLTGMLHAATVRSPHAHARIVSIDTSLAEALPGVRGVVTRDDFPDQGDRVVELGEGSVNMRHLSANADPVFDISIGAPSVGPAPKSTGHRGLRCS